MNVTTINGVFEAEIIQSSSGENKCLIELINNDGKSLYDLVGEYLDEPVKITIERQVSDKF